MVAFHLFLTKIYLKKILPSRILISSYFKFLRWSTIRLRSSFSLPITFYLKPFGHPVLHYQICILEYQIAIWHTKYGFGLPNLDILVQQNLRAYVWSIPPWFNTVTLPLSEYFTGIYEGGIDSRIFSNVTIDDVHWIFPYGGYIPRSVSFNFLYLEQCSKMGLSSQEQLEGHGQFFTFTIK